MGKNENDIKASIEYFEKFGSILGLERIESLLKRLGNPQEDLKIIHVGGTNGKGSVRGQADIAWEFTHRRT